MSFLKRFKLAKTPAKRNFKQLTARGSQLTPSQVPAQVNDSETQLKSETVFAVCNLDGKIQMRSLVQH